MDTDRDVCDKRHETCVIIALIVSSEGKFYKFLSNTCIKFFERQYTSCYFWYLSKIIFLETFCIYYLQQQNLLLIGNFYIDFVDYINNLTRSWSTINISEITHLIK